jgi:hypothetical protein
MIALAAATITHVYRAENPTATYLDQESSRKHYFPVICSELPRTQHTQIAAQRHQPQYITIYQRLSPLCYIASPRRVASLFYCLTPASLPPHIFYSTATLQRISSEWVAIKASKAQRVQRRTTRASASAANSSTRREQYQQGQDDAAHEHPFIE